MESDSWTRLYSSLRRHQLRSDAFHTEDCEGEEEHRPQFMCPFCVEDFDIVGLCCHIDEEHEVEAMNGVCPFCVKKVGSDLVHHMIMQHGSLLKISFWNCPSYLHYATRTKRIFFCFYYLPWFFLTKCNAQPRRRLRRGVSNLSFSILRKELREGNLQSLLAPPSHTDADALLTSFMYSPPNAVADDDEPSNVLQPLSSTDTSSVVESSVEEFNRVVKQSLLSDEDMMEHTRRCEFVQELLLSTFVDDIL